MKTPVENVGNEDHPKRIPKGINENACIKWVFKMRGCPERILKEKI